jgi:hypothetical protein
MTIQGIMGKFKTLRLQSLMLPAVVVMVGFVSFGLGRLSTLEGVKPGLTILYPPGYSEMLGAAAPGARLDGVPASGEVVASKQGSKYFLPTCSGAKVITAKNLITFASAAEAEKAGYTPAGNCKGLQ